jgi:glutathione S-transferase
MSDITLYMAPGTCARVTAICLFELGLKFDTEVVRFMKGQHKSPEYKALNPLGKVPALLIDDQVLTENVAILRFLNARYGQIFPEANNDFEEAQQLEDLCFCSSTLHPIVTRIRIPQMFSEAEHAATIKANACAQMDEFFSVINARLEHQDWWYGEQWSAMDAYIFWVYWRVEGADYDVSRFPHFVAHAQRMNERASVEQAIDIENSAIALLESEGLNWTPPKVK